MKNVKRNLKKLTTLFALAALPTVPVMAQPVDPVGLWKTLEHNMIAEVQNCNDGLGQMCATIYRTTREPVENALEREKARYADARISAPPPSLSLPQKAKPEDYCEIYKTTRASKTGENTWESDSITVAGFISARASLKQDSDNHAKGEARVKLFGVPIANIGLTGEKITRESPEFKPCKNLKP